MSDREYSAKDKVVSRMTRDGLEEVNVTQGTAERVSKRLSECSFDKETVHDEAFQGHSRFRQSGTGTTAGETKRRDRQRNRSDQTAIKLEKAAIKSEKQLEKVEREISRQEKRFARSEKKAAPLLPRLKIRRKEMYRTVIDPETGETNRELYRYGMYRPRFVRAVKKPANRFSLKEHAVRAGKRKAVRKIENEAFEGEGSENVGLQAAHSVYRAQKYRHRYKHRKDYLKSKRHKRYRAYVQSKQRLQGLTATRHKLIFETTVNRHMADIARAGEKEAEKKLTETQKKALRHEAQKKAYKKKYQRAKYAESHGSTSSVKLLEFVKKKDSQKRAMTEAREVMSMFGSVLGGVFLLLAAAGLIFFAVLIFIFFCAGYTGTTDTDVGNITECDAYFSEKETELRDEIANIEDEKDGFDEYRYFVNGSKVSGTSQMYSYIGHDSIILSSFLAVCSNSYELSNSADLMQAVFDEMYTLEYKEVTETRTDDEGNDYDVEILEVYLTVKELDEVVKGLMNENQTQQWELLNHTGGNQQIFANPFDFDWSNDISSQYGWRIHPISGDKKFHAGVDIAEPQGTEIHACSSGTVTVAKYSSSAGNYIAIQDKDGFVIKYMHCHELYVSQGDEVEQGDIIAIVGTTGNSTGNHLHLQIEDPSGNTLNPLFVVRF